MSLRHPFPDFVVRPGDHLKEPHRTPPRLTSPAYAEFLARGDLSDVLQKIDNGRYTRVDAGTNTGKSARLPLNIVKNGAKLVIHTVPGRLLAHSTGKYVATTTKTNVQVVFDTDVEMITEGLVVMANAAYIARVAFGGAAMPPHVLYIDESHESDCATVVVRETALSKPHVERLVLATATDGPTNFRQSAAIAQVIKYPKERTPSRWMATDEGMPWHWENLNANTLMFVERETDVRRLIGEYADYGFLCYRLTAKSTPQELMLQCFL